MKIIETIATTENRENLPNNFDSLRLLGALLVFYSHQFAIAARPEPAIFNGGLGVIIFFSISGFLVMKSWRRDPHIFRFLLKRFLRLWPGMAVAATICVCMLGPAVSELSATQYFKSTEFRRYLSILIFSLHEGNFFPTNPYPQLNGSLWTIPIEAGCYILLAMAGGIGALRYRWAMPFSLLAFGTGYVFIFNGNNGLLEYVKTTLGLPLIVPYIFYGLVFLSGVSISNYSKYFLSGRGLRVSVGIAILLGLSSVSAFKLEITLLLMVPIIVIAIGVRSWPIVREAGRFGDFSYGIYLYAWPVQQTIVWLLGKSTSYSVLFTVSLAVTAMLAYLSWHLVEKRALKLKPRNPLNFSKTVIQSFG